jgi:outer membrane receptor protein involved in Fe transport
MLGLPFTSTRQFLLPPDERFRNEWGAYFQDDIKVTPYLTVNLGIRYDYFQRWKEKNE